MTWIEVTHEYQDLDGVETLPGGKCDVTIWTYIGLRQYMEVRLKSLDPDPDEIGPGWR